MARSVSVVIKLSPEKGDPGYFTSSITSDTLTTGKLGLKASMAKGKLSAGKEALLVSSDRLRRGFFLEYTAKAIDKFRKDSAERKKKLYTDVLGEEWVNKKPKGFWYM